jgi:hypothetical protein
VYKDYKGSPASLFIRKLPLIRQIKEGHQIGIGNTTDELYQHVYLKTTDDGVTLPLSERRARLEIRLQGEKIASRNFEDWKSFPFQSLSKFFNFRTRKADLNPLMQMLEEASYQIGERGERNTKVGKRLYSLTTEAEKTLNSKAYEALRNLSNRWDSN